jgi:hypothetical protein
MPLSDTAILFFVLRGSGCVGRLTSGRIERDGEARLTVHTGSGVNSYISGENLRSWCVVGPDRRPLAGWDAVTPEDRLRLFLAD